MNTFTAGGTTIDMGRAHDQGGGYSSELYQVSGRSSDGEYYVYTKSTVKRRMYQTTYSDIDIGKLTEFIDFFKTKAVGTKNTVTWVDHLEDSKTVKFSEPTFDWDKTGPDSYMIGFKLEELQ